MSENCITSDRIQALAKEINALGYVECSSLDGYEDSVQLVLHKMALTAFQAGTTILEQQDRKCIIA